MSESGQPQKIKPRPEARNTIIAASGPSLSELHWQVNKAAFAGWFIIAVQDAVDLCPLADVLYGCDEKWWRHHKGKPKYLGERWSSHDTGTNQKLNVAEEYGINLVRGENGGEFSTNPGLIRYGSNSGFQAVNLAILMGAKVITLFGFDHRQVNGKQHFFGDHPNNWTQGGFEPWIREWQIGARSLPADVQVYNCTPGSALKQFEQRSPDELSALAT